MVLGSEETIMLIDFDTCDFITTCSALSYLLPCEIRRSSSWKGYHIKSKSSYGLDFDDTFRQYLRRLGHPIVFFSQKAENVVSEWFKLTNLNDFLKVNV